jgi:enamine deaminase RidA (YjgF/YER057c/UK114 family)
MRVKPMLLALVFLISTPAFAYPYATSSSGELKATTTVAGSFYSSQQTLDRGFPFSDAVRATGNLVFLSGLVVTDPDGELVEGGLAPETHAIFRQMQSHLQQFNLDLKDVVKCLVMIDNIDE